ncbi:glycosyltransferase [Patiriisocius marinistellae]|nr:glycosyltransferase [Patiriisocius marinistellae]
MQDNHKKICIVAISLGKGGAERSSAMLSQMLSNKGHNVHIVILNDNVDFKFSGTLFNLGVFKKQNDTLLKRLKRFRRLRKFLINENFDVIIDHRSKNSYWREQFYNRYIYKGLKKIYVVHSSNLSGYFTEMPLRFASVYNKNVCTIGVSIHISEEIKKMGVTNCNTIYNSYNPEWGAGKNELPNILKDKKYLLTYGRIEDAIKDFSFLIHSFQASKIWQQDVFLVIMGDGKDKERIKELAESQECKSHIVFIPFNKNPFSIVANAQFTTLTSKYEGFPMVLVESLSLGTPVVSLDIVSGPSEIIIHKLNGLLVKERSIPLFSKAIHEMITNKELLEYCKRNAKVTVTKFSMEEVSKQWDTLIQNELH